MHIKKIPKAMMLALVASAGAGYAETPSDIKMTWFGITNWYYEIGDTGILMDGAVSRWWEDDATSDPTEVARVFGGLDQGAGIDFIFIGHEHADHSIDAVEWARLTGAPIYTSKEACDTAIEKGLPAQQCNAVYGGEVVDVADHTQVRIVRWAHSVSCDKTSNGGTEGIETFGFLFTTKTDQGTRAWFMSDSGAGNEELVTNRIVDGVDYGAPLANLSAAVRDAGLSGFDLWQGGPESRVVNQARVLIPVYDVKTIMPQHYGARGGYDLTKGLHYPYDAAEMPKLQALLKEHDVQSIVSTNYFDAYVYDEEGIQTVENSTVKLAMGLPETGPGPGEQGVNPRAGEMECPQD